MQDDDREQRIVEHRGLVRSIASRMAQRLPDHLDLADLVACGTVGLIDAVDRFEPSRGVPFRAYAEIRIRGAILDAVRGAEWVPRSVRRRLTEVEAVRSDLRQQLGREPERGEVATAMGIEPEEYDSLVAARHARGALSLEQSSGGARIADTVRDESGTAEDRWIGEEHRDALSDALGALPERERLVTTLYYLRGLSLREIAASLGVTESRASQLRSQGIRRLQERLGANGEHWTPSPRAAGRADQREYPRMRVPVRVRYLSAADDASAAAWLRGEAVGEPCAVEDARVDFSATGLAFDAQPVRLRERLLVELTLPDDTVAWRCTARVVRVTPQEVDVRVAVAFEEISEEASRALANYTLRVQEEMAGS